MIKEDKIKIFSEILSQFETEEFRLYCEDMIDEMPEYIWKIPASTSFRYHSKTQCQPGGEILHILLCCTIMNYALSLEYLKNKWSNPIQRDCLRTAICLHDALKCGLEGSQYTVHEHPILGQQWVIETKVEHDIDLKYKKYIGRAIASHSGEWTENKRSSVILPKPENDEHFLVHLCDLLGSRSNIDMVYSNEILELLGQANPIEVPDINEWIMVFGKYKENGLTLPQIKEIDPDYIRWCKENMNAEPARTLLKQL